MSLKNIFFLALSFIGCTSENYLVAQNERIVEVEVPIYIESEVPKDAGLVWVDSFIQPRSVDGVDVLWVIDTSGSMQSYDPYLISGIEAMLSALPQTGWRLAMMSADPTKSLLETQFPLVPGDDIMDALAMYDAMLTGGLEQGFEAVYNYIVNNPYAGTWLREDASLLVVFVSDEEEQSELFPLVSDFVRWYSGLRGGSVYAASIVNFSVQESICEPPPLASDVGDRYLEVIDLIGGIKVDICSEDWSSGVTDASELLEPYEYIELSHRPEQDSIRVFVNGELYNNWHYVLADNRVYFDILPSGGDLVEVGYRYIAADTGT